MSFRHISPAVPAILFMLLAAGCGDGSINTGPDAGTPDVLPSDAGGAQDTGGSPLDAGADAGPADASPGDALPSDTGPVDASPGDTSPADGGDAGAGDSGDAGSPDSGDAGGGDAGPPVTVDPKDGLPVFRDRVTEIPTGGDTICSRGTEYAFFAGAGAGRTNKLAIHFEGGGACWTKESCSFAGSLFNDSLDGTRENVRKHFGEGMYNQNNPDNPFRDWFHVYVPYCTGDIHWGDNEVSYAPGEKDEVKIRHRGQRNARAVLEWVYKHFKKPEQIFVTGCSAGSYGSIMWAPHIMKHYEGVRVDHHGDSGAGVITEQFFRDSFPKWKFEGALPAWIPELDPAKNDIRDKSLADLYHFIAKANPAQRFSQFNFYNDDTQVFFFSAMGGGKDPNDWGRRMVAMDESIRTRTPNYSSFIAPGKDHCITPYERFYTVQSNGVRYVDWLKQLVGPASPTTVICPECKSK